MEDTPMKETYIVPEMEIIGFDSEDVITTSIETDRNNAYQDIKEMTSKDNGGRAVPNGWY